MSNENDLPPNHENTVTDADLEADRRANAIAKSHVRRELKAFRAEFDELKKLLTSQQTSTGKRAAGPGDAPNEWQEKFEQLQREMVQTKREAKRQGVQRQLSDLLAKRGITGNRASAVLALWETSGRLDITDAGARLSVTRSRVKGEAAETLEFENLEDAVSDWVRTPEAADFLPAPTIPSQANRSGQRPKMPHYSTPAKTTTEMARRAAEQLSAQGVDVPYRSAGPSDPRIEKTVEDLRKKGIDVMGSMLVSDEGDKF